MHEITITDGYTVAASGPHEYYTTAVELTRSTAIDLRRPSGGGRAAAAERRTVELANVGQSEWASVRTGTASL